MPSSISAIQQIHVCLCIHVTLRVCVCVCVRKVPEGSEDWAAALYSDWTDTNVSGICHVFLLPPTQWSVCVFDEKWEKLFRCV